MNELGAAIRHARQAKGLSQSELGRLTGFKNSYIAKIELGRQKGSPAAISKLVAVLDLPGEVIISHFGLNMNPKKRKFTPADYRFSELPAELKSILLEIGVILQRHA